MKLGLNRVHRITLFSQLAPVKVRLMLLARGMRKVRVLSGVECEAKSAFERAEVVSEDVWIVAYVSCFYLKLTQTLFSEAF